MYRGLSVLGGQFVVGQDRRMIEPRPLQEPQRILSFWWMLELFAPQQIPKLTRGSSRPADRQVIECTPGEPLPWETLPTPKQNGSTPRVWRHTVYLGVYEVEDTYEHL